MAHGLAGDVGLDGRLAVHQLVGELGGVQRGEMQVHDRVALGQDGAVGLHLGALEPVGVVVAGPHAHIVGVGEVVADEAGRLQRREGHGVDGDVVVVEGEDDGLGGHGGRAGLDPALEVVEGHRLEAVVLQVLDLGAEAVGVVGGAGERIESVVHEDDHAAAGAGGETGVCVVHHDLCGGGKRGHRQQRRHRQVPHSGCKSHVTLPRLLRTIYADERSLVYSLSLKQNRTWERSIGTCSCVAWGGVYPSPTLNVSASVLDICVSDATTTPPWPQYANRASAPSVRSAVLSR